MQTLLFEVNPRAGHEDHYFKHAAALRPKLDQQPGLIAIDRYKSDSRSNVILSYSLWKDEASLARWRTDPHHHRSQLAGRNRHFADYRLRISQALLRYSRESGFEDWSDSGAYNDEALVRPRYLCIVASDQEPYQGKGESFQSVNQADSFVTLINVESAAVGRSVVETTSKSDNVSSSVWCLISRDYGMFDRDEAPQYFAPVCMEK
jgi:heme-degrading monooxygenase HmoA